MLDIIKQYMVSLGAIVDNKSFKSAEGVLKKLALTLNVTIAKEIFNAAKGMFNFALSVGDADRQAGMLARRLMTTKENARSLDVAMKAMKIGSLDELREIGLDPEQRKQFLELKALARSLENPKYAKSMKEVRALNFEFQKMQVKLEYFKTELVAKMVGWAKELSPYWNKAVDNAKLFVGPIKGLFKEAKSTMPTIFGWTRRYAKYISPIFNIFKASVIFCIKGFAFIFKGIRELAPSFEASFRIIKHVLDPIIKLFKFIEDLVVYLAGGESYREKQFDKYAPLRNARKAANGEIKESTFQSINEKVQKSFSYSPFNSEYTSAKANGFNNGETFGDFKINNHGDLGKLALGKEEMAALKFLSDHYAFENKGLTITSGWDLMGHWDKEGGNHKDGLASDIQGSISNTIELIRAMRETNNFRNLIYEANAADLAKARDLFGADIKNIKFMRNDKLSSPIVHSEAKSLEEQAQNRNITINNNFTINGAQDPNVTSREVIRDMNIAAISGMPY